MDSFFPDVLSFPDDNNDVQMDAPYPELNPNTSSYFPPQGGFLESNADLNSFFPGSGLTPLGTPGIGYGASTGLPNYPWNNDHQQMLNQPIYPTQQMPQQMTLDPNAITGATIINSTNDLSSNSSSSPTRGNLPCEDLSKPKRGRPRKKREKKQLTMEEENAKRQKFLERNRLAASKCRDRKKNWTQDTLDKLVREERKHGEMQMQYRELHTVIQSLLQSACEHSVHCNKDSTFQQSLSAASDRFAAIGCMHEIMTGPHDHEEYDDADDIGSPASDEPPRKVMRRDTRNSSVAESVQSVGDILHRHFNDREGLKLKHPSVESSPRPESSSMSRQASGHSSRSSGDRDSGISARESPAKTKLHFPTDEGFFGSEDSKTDTTSHHHTMPPVVMMPNPRLVGMDFQGGQAKLDALMYGRNFAIKPTRS